VGKLEAIRASTARLAVTTRRRAVFRIVDRRGDEVGRNLNTIWEIAQIGPRRADPSRTTRFAWDQL
jgi:hypothetical protein